MNLGPDSSVMTSGLISGTLSVVVCWLQFPITENLAYACGLCK